MSSITMPNIGMLPMEDIAQSLTENHNIAKKTLQSDNTMKLIADNTEKVGDLDKSQVAKCVEKNLVVGQDFTNQQTVANALNLNGHSSAYYAKAEDLLGLTESSNQISINYIKEINNLRMELASMQNQLIKRGCLYDNEYSNSFIDSFNKDNIKYNEDSYVVKDNSILNKSFLIDPTQSANESMDFENKFICPKEKMIMVKRDPETNAVLLSSTVTVSSIKAVENGQLEITVYENIDAFKTQSGELNFSGAVSAAIAPVYLYKSFGEYNNGSFSFSSKEKGTTMGKEKYINLNDDTNIMPIQINKEKYGFATQFKVPAISKGYISNLTIFAKSIMTPGDLICYIVKASDMPTIYNIATEYSKIVGKSKSISYESFMDAKKQLTFDFIKDDGTYPYLNDERYCIIIMCEDASNGQGKWELDFGFTNTEDIHKNMSTHVYYVDPNNIKPAIAMDLESADNIITTTSGSKESIKKYDLLFELCLREEIVHDESGYKEGMYTSIINIPNGIKNSKISLALRTSREGYFCFRKGQNDKAYITSDEKIIPIIDDSLNFKYNPILNSSSTGIGIKYGEHFIAGGNIFINKNQAINNELMIYGPSDTNKTSHYIGKSEDIYRAAYDIYITPMKKTWNNGADNQYKFLYEPLCEPIKMELTGMLKDGFEKPIKTSTDRLLYECVMPKDAISNDIEASDTFEIQIKWNSNHPDNFLKTYPDLIGRLYELSIGFTPIVER